MFGSYSFATFSTFCFFAINVDADDSWQKYIIGPQDAIVYPTRIISTNGNVSNPDGLLPGASAPAVFTRASGDANTNASAVVVDFGLNTVGFLRIDFGNSSNNVPGIRLAFSETQEYLTNISDFTRSDNGDTITPGTDQVAVAPNPFSWIDTYGCLNGTQVCADGLHGFRYLKIYLDALASDSPITADYGTVEITSVSLNYSGFLGTPDTYKGWFESSDTELNQFWYDAVYTNEMVTDTVRATDIDPRYAASPTLEGKLVLLDGAKRDRDPYVGDIAVSGRTDYVTHYTGAATRNIIADLAEHQRADGWIPPASINNYTLPLFDYPLWWATTSWDYVLYTGDVSYGNTYYPNLLALLDTWCPAITNTTGLLSKGLASTDSYGDYAFLPRYGEVTYYNTLYVLALQSGASIADMLNKTADAVRWRTRAALVTEAINANLWDSNVGAYLDSQNGTVLHPQDGNSIAIIAQVANSSRATSALQYLSSKALSYGNPFMDNDSLGIDFSQRVYAFISYFEIQARFLAGQPASALDEIRRLYGWMTSHDPQVTVWEGIGPNGSMYEGPYTSAAHGWSTGVVPALTNFVLGLTPIEAGYSKFQVKPYPGDVSWARGQAPSMYGPVAVSWALQKSSFCINVTAPVGTSFNVSVPVTDASARVYADGQLAWNGSTILYGATFAGDYVELVRVPSGFHQVKAVASS